MRTFSAICLLATVLLSVASDSGQDTELKSRLGFTIGTPAGINLVFTHDLSLTKGFRLAGFALPESNGVSIAGVQGDFLVSWKRSRTFCGNYVIGAGTSVIEDHDDIDRWTYALGGVNILWHTLFAGTGVTVGTGDYPNPQLALELGLLFRL